MTRHAQPRPFKRVHSRALGQDPIGLPANAGVLLYTDGLPDAVGDGGRFATAGISDAVARHRGGGAALVDGLLASLDAFISGHPLSDDVTILTAIVGLPGLA